MPTQWGSPRAARMSSKISTISRKAEYHLIPFFSVPRTPSPATCAASLSSARFQARSPRYCSRGRGPSLPPLLSPPLFPPPRQSGPCQPPQLHNLPFKARPPEARAAAQLENARKAGAVIEGGQIIPHPDGQGGLLHHTGFALSSPREHPAAGTSIPYRDDHGRQHQIPVQGMRRITDTGGSTYYHFMVDGKPVSVPEGATPLFQIDQDGKRYTQAPDGTRRELGYDRMAAAQAGIVPREGAARKALDQTLARGTEHYGGFIEEYRRRQADIHQYKTAAAETPQDSEWQKTARSAQGDPRTWDTQLIAEVENRDPAKAAAMRQALMPQPTKRLFDAAQKSFAAGDAAGVQPAPETSDSVPEKSMTLHEMLMQAPAMTQGQGEHQPPADLAADARSTAQHALGISDPENVRVTRSADGTYTLSRPAAEGSGTHQPFATLDPKTNRLTLTPGPDGQPGHAATDMAAKGSPHGTPIYLPGTQTPLSAAERSELIAKGLHATSTTTDRRQADAALTQAGLSPQGIRQLVNEGRLSVQDGKFLNDKFNGGVSSYAAHSAAAPPQPQDSQDKTDKLTPESIAEQLRLRADNEQFLHQQYPQVPMDELRRNYNAYRDDYVRKNYDLPDGVDDKTLHHLTTQKQDREKQEVETSLKAQQAGFKAALDDLGSLKGLTQRQQDGPGAGKDALHFFKGYHALFAVLSKHRDLLQTLSDSIERDMTGKAREGDAAALASAREKLIDLPDDERRIVLAALHNEAQKRGAVNGAAKGGAGYADAAKQLLQGLFTAGMTKDGSSFWQQTGEAGWRILHSGISGNSHANTLDVLKSVPTTGRVTYTGDIRTAEDARRFVEAEMIHAHAVNASVAGDGPAILPREGSELMLTPEQTRLIEDAKNRLARGVRMAQEISALGSDVDPIPNLFASTLGSSAAMMGLMAASRGAAAPFIASLYKGAAYEELSLKYPEASHEARLKAATLSAVIQTAGDYVGVKAFSGLNIGKLLANPQGLTAAVIGRGLGRVALSNAVENGVEAGQDIATPAIIEALKLDFPGFDWQQEKKDFWKGRADVAIGMLPLTLLGLGAASVKDYANSKALLSDDAMLARQGLPENYRKDIIEAAQRGDTATAQRLLQEGFQKRDPAIAAKSQQEMDAETDKLDGTVMPDGNQNPNQRNPRPAVPTQPAVAPQGKPHISGGVPELPDGAKLQQSSEHWFIFERDGKKWVRFYAPEARSPNTAKKGGHGDGHDSSAAFLTPEGRIYVEEGQHRLNGVVLEGETNLSSVPGHPKWLEYEFKGTTEAKGKPPAYNPGEPHENVNRINPWDGLPVY